MAASIVPGKVILNSLSFLRTCGLDGACRGIQLIECNDKEKHFYRNGKKNIDHAAIDSGSVCRGKMELWGELKSRSVVWVVMEMVIAF